MEAPVVFLTAHPEAVGAGRERGGEEHEVLVHAARPVNLQPAEWQQQRRERSTRERQKQTERKTIRFSVKTCEKDAAAFSSQRHTMRL
eukprot:3225209-Rhodomonas_salina.3